MQRPQTTGGGTGKSASALEDSFAYMHLPLAIDNENTAPSSTTTATTTTTTIAAAAAAATATAAGAAHGNDDDDGEKRRRRYPLLSRLFKRCTYQCAMFMSTCVDKGVRGLGPLLAAACCAMITMVVYAYFMYVVPAATAAYGETITQYCTMFGVFLAVNIYFNHLSCCFTAPGSPPSDLEPVVVARLRLDPELNPYKKDHVENRYRFCKWCRVIKPMRTHHCSVCKRCVLKMDHHCPWVNNCVGWRNYRYFVLFLMYLCIGTIFFVLMSRPLYGSLNALQHTIFPTALVLCMSGGLATFGFLVWNVLLLVTNQTTLEFNSRCGRRRHGDGVRARNAFDMGVVANCRQVFGARSMLTWWMPTYAEPKGCADGMIFPINVVDCDDDLFDNRQTV